MKKPKKITVKFFVHESLKPKVEDGVERFPLYMRITYQRRNTMLKSFYGGYYKDLKEVEKLHYPGFLEFEERNIQKTINYEIAKLGEAFDLKGVHEKYEVYCIGIYKILESYFKNVLWMAALRSEPAEYAKALNFSDEEVSFETLFQIGRKIYPVIDKHLPKDFEEEIEIYQLFTKLYQGSFFQYTFPTVVEWLDGSAITDYRKKLDTFLKGDKRKLERHIAVINRIVNTGIS
ncbi:MAG: hypothetical protein NVV82_07190 [Sporocytophaga sp.]|nr:hypothetical protein [Sporocytophaga sp.]